MTPAGERSLASGLPQGVALAMPDMGTDQWQTLADTRLTASAIDQTLTLASLDPANLANGVYQLRLSAWDLSGRVSEIHTSVIIDSAPKAPSVSATDALYTLGGHAFALTRTLDKTVGPDLSRNGQGAFGNWSLPSLDTRLTTDQPASEASGMTAAWATGARVWLSLPADLADPASLAQLRFTLGASATAPLDYQATFTGTGDATGWALTATHGNHLQRLGNRLYDSLTGLPWVPDGYTLSAPNGTQYQLDAQGQVTGVTFADGTQWLVSDSGIALVGSQTDRITFQRDEQGRITRVTGPDGSVGPVGQGDARTVVYRYDAQGRLTLARATGDNSLGAPYGHDAQGQLFTDTLTANLGSAANWLGNSNANTWNGIFIVEQHFGYLGTGLHANW